MSDNLLIKSFLFEVVNTQSQTVFTSFTLVIPPQRVTIKESQRVNITKTFGNAFIDDYGPDNLLITISGFSGTSKAFPTFQTSGKAATAPLTIGGDTFNSDNAALSQLAASGGATGSKSGGAFDSKSAFYAFRDSIMRYKDNVDFDQYELRVYDLGDGQAYKCILLDFTLDRTANLPFRYPFSIDLFVYARMGTKDVSKSSPIVAAKNPTFSLTNITNALNSMQAQFPGFAAIQTIKNTVSVISQQVAQLQGAFLNWLNEGQSIATSPLWAAKTLIASFKTLNTTVVDAYNIGLLTLNDYMNAKSNINNQLESALSVYAYAISNTTSATTKVNISTSKGLDFTTNPASPSPTSNVASYIYGGLTQYTVKGGDTLQTIAQSQLGDSSLWVYIAAVNVSIGSNADLLPNTKIFIPVQSNQQSSNKNQYIITENPQSDTYGTDLAIDSNGNIVVSEGGDLSTNSGIINILQAINMRLNTLAGSLVKQTTFGLISASGLPGTSYALNYAAINLKDSLIQDPRVSSVDNVIVNISGDSIFMSADITPVGSDIVIPVSQTIGA